MPELADIIDALTVVIDGDDKLASPVTFAQVKAAVAAADTAVDLNDQELTGLATPSADTSAANKEYVDDSITAVTTGYVPTTRTITASTGLTGGGDLSANRTLTVSFGTSSGTAAEGNDSRLSDSRAPTGSAGGDLGGTYPSPTVAAIHETSGPTKLTIGAVADGQELIRSGSTLIGADRVPATRTITAGTGLSGGGDLSANRTLAVTYGSSSGTAAEGNDSRITGALQKSGGTMSGAIAMGDNAITGLPLPENDDEAANKEYVDSIVGGGVTFEGIQTALATADSAVDFNDQKLTGVATPVDPTDAANKDYVDDAITSVSSGYVPTSRTISAGTGLTGGGDLSANRTLTVAYGTSSTTACVGDDSRLSDSRAPSGSAGGDLGSTYPNPTVTAIHETGGPTKLTFGTITDGHDLVRSGTTIVSLARVPTGRTITAGTGLSGGGDLSSDRTLTVSYGTSSSTACVGNDSRLSDSRAPNGSASGDLGGSFPSPTVTALHESGGQKLTLGAVADGQDLVRSGTDIVGLARVPTSRTITASTGLTGGGDLSANRSLAVDFGSTSSTACVGNDSRLSDSRAPTGTAGGDLGGTYPNPTVAAIHETGASTKLTFGTITDGQDLVRSGTTIVSLARVPTSRTITAGTGLTGGGDLSSDRTLTVAYGTSSTTATVGNDSRVTGALQTAGGTMTGQLKTTATTSTYNATRTFDVSTNDRWVFTDTWTGNITITLSNGADGLEGQIWGKQDGSGSRTVTFTVSGRTALMDDGITAFNTSIAAANKVFGIGYMYQTIGGTAYVLFSVLPVKTFA